jgi:hypothetical protein
LIFMATCQLNYSTIGYVYLNDSGIYLENSL